MTDTDKEEELEIVALKLNPTVVGVIVQIVRQLGVSTVLLGILLWAVLLPLKDGHIEFLKQTTIQQQKTTEVLTKMEDTLGHMRNENKEMAEQTVETVRENGKKLDALHKKLENQ